MKQEQKDNNIAWSLYWAEDRLHSCVATDDEADQKILNQLWASFSDKLPDAAQVMDLATGNGAVPAALLAAKPSLKIAAVDLADIQPQTFLKNRPDYREQRPFTGVESRVRDAPEAKFPQLLDPIDDQPPATAITWLFENDVE